MSFKPDFVYQTKVFNVIFYSIDYLFRISFLFYILFSLFYVGLKAANIHSPSCLRGSLQSLRMLVQSEPHSHTEYVHFEPSLVIVPHFGSIKDFHVVGAVNVYCDSRRIRNYAIEHKNDFFITNCLILFDSFSNLAIIDIVIDIVFLKLY